MNGVLALPRSASSRRSIGAGWRATLLGAALLSALALSMPPRADAAPPQAGNAERGRVLYETGRRSDGSEVLADRPGIGPVPTEARACAGCHRRSTLGDQEASLLVPPLAGHLLFAPMRRSTLVRAHPALQRQELRAHRRPAYTLGTLARALTHGRDSAGQRLAVAMPRYHLSAADVADLAAHFNAVSARQVPGVTDGQMRLATVFTPDASPQARDTVQATMTAWAARMRIGPWKVQWRPWNLQGSADTWPDQLQALWAQESVFALVSGAGAADWRAVADFCEARAVPCVFPTLERAPPQASHQYFSAYLSAGVEAEASLLAHWLQPPAAGPQRELFSLIDPQDASAQAAHQALTARLAEQGVAVRPAASGTPPTTDLPLAAETLLAGLLPHQAAMLWLRPAALQPLLDRSRPPAGRRVWLSATLAPPHLLRVPPAWREHLAWASLHSDPMRRQAGGALSVEPWAQRLGLAEPLDPPVLADVHAATVFFGDALGRMREGLSTAYLMERLEASVDMRPAGAGYFRLSLAPGQRVAAKGGHVLGYVSATSLRVQPISSYLPAPTAPLPTLGR